MLSALNKTLILQGKYYPHFRDGKSDSHRYENAVQSSTARNMGTTIHDQALPTSPQSPPHLHPQVTCNSPNREEAETKTTRKPVFVFTGGSGGT